MKHTPGPWTVNKALEVRINENDPPPDVVNILGTEIDKITGRPKGVALTDKANAHLISAAPEMLEALEKYMKPWDSDYPDHQEDIEIYEAIKSAIAKAKGESS